MVSYNPFWEFMMEYYIAFIDLSKAHDGVPRGKLIKILKRLGCGVTIVLAQMSVSTTTTCSADAHPVCYVCWHAYKKVKQQCGDDRLLKWLHVLTLMDDGLILATARETLTEKQTFWRNTVVNVACWWMKIKLSSWLLWDLRKTGNLFSLTRV